MGGPAMRRPLTVRYRPVFAMLACASSLAAQDPTAGARAVLRTEFIGPESPTASVHASTIAETAHGLVAAWFGGSAEGASDVGIWLARKSGATWSVPIEVATGTEPDGKRYPCWNPVLFPASPDNLLLFYKAGPSPGEWWGMVRASRDGGITWSAPRRLPSGILGPIKDKPVWVAGGVLIAPSSTESMDRPSRWRIHFELSGDTGRTWQMVAPASLPNDSAIDAIQPSVLVHADGRLQAVGRTRRGRIFETWSADTGRTWDPLRLTPLPNPNAGIDAVTLRDGRQLLVYNHSTSGRTPLNVAVSRDGETWEAALVLESGPGEYSYPAVIQSADGLVHITYTWQRRRIRHVVLDPKSLVSRPMPRGNWPPR
jgi:predicted neuraminidase